MRKVAPRTKPPRPTHLDMSTQSGKAMPHPSLRQALYRLLPSTNREGMVCLIALACIGGGFLDYSYSHDLVRFMAFLIVAEKVTYGGSFLQKTFRRWSLESHHEKEEACYPCQRGWVTDRSLSCDIRERRRALRKDLRGCLLSQCYPLKVNVFFVR